MTMRTKMVTAKAEGPRAARGHGPRSPMELTARQLGLLRRVSSRTAFGGVLAIHETARETGLDRNLVSKILFQLYHGGLVDRVEQPCGCNYYKATPKGDDFLRQADALKKGACLETSPCSVVGTHSGPFRLNKPAPPDPSGTF